jgi:hypothetical protein
MMTDPKFIDVDGIQTRYFDRGSDEVLLLAHDSHMGTLDACESVIDWEFNFDVLSQRKRHSIGLSREISRSRRC